MTDQQKTIDRLIRELAAANTALKTETAEHQRAMAAVLASEEKLRAISDGALDAVVVIDPTGAVIHWNPAAENMFGYRQAEILGRNVHETLVPERFRQKARDGLKRFAQTGQGPAVGHVLELKALRKDGSEFAIEIAVSPIRIDSQWRAAAIVRDISERKQAEKTLREEREHLERLLEMYERDRKLTAFEIHDGLIQSITAALLELEGGLSAAKAQAVKELPSGVTNSVRLLRQALREARRLMGGLRPAVLDELGLLAAIEHLVRERRELGGPNVEYSPDVHFGRLTPPLETAIFRIVQEGLTNALRYSQSQTVRLSLVQRGDRLVVEVEDSGVGFDPETVVGDHFGLEGIRLRAELFGGEATFNSRSGRGSLVRVELPLVERETNPSPATDEE